jgi:hypothetical protein
MKVYNSIVLVHCNPAPPHPHPGTVSNAICLGPFGDLVVAAVTVVLFVLFVIWSIQHLPGHIGGSR